MTAEQIKILRLGIAPLDDRSILMVESALHWVLDNTSLEFDCENDEDLKALHPNVRLFILKYFDAMSIQAGVASESISGLSQSFRTDSASSLIWQYAEELLGEWLYSRVRFVTAKRKWRRAGEEPIPSQTGSPTNNKKLSALNVELEKVLDGYGG